MQIVTACNFGERVCTVFLVFISWGKSSNKFTRRFLSAISEPEVVGFET